MLICIRHRIQNTKRCLIAKFIMEEISYIYIPTEVISSKNSKRIVKNSNTVRLIGSKASLNYKKNTSAYYMVFKNEFVNLLKNIEKPYYIGLYFLRGTRGKFDYNNMGQTVFDRMVENNWIEDDNANFIIPVMLGHTVCHNKKDAGVLITVIPSYKQIPEYIEYFNSSFKFN